MSMEDALGDMAEAMSINCENQMELQWHDTKRKLDSMLISTKIHARDDVRDMCNALSMMNYDERIEYIKKHWGEKYLESVLPILQQLDTIERNL